MEGEFQSNSGPISLTEVEAPFSLPGAFVSPLFALVGYRKKTEAALLDDFRLYRGLFSCHLYHNIMVKQLNSRERIICLL